MNDILGQLARSGLLLPDMATAILAGNIPPIEEIVTAVLISVQDANAVVAADQQSSWNEKRLARSSGSRISVCDGGGGRSGGGRIIIGRSRAGTR